MPNYIGPEIGLDEAVKVRDHITNKSEWAGIEEITIVVLDSEGTVILSEGPEVEAATAKALSALLQAQDTITFQHTWNESAWSTAGRGWIRSERPHLDEGDQAEIRERLEPNFSLEGGGTLLKDQSGAAVIGAVGVVTNRGEIVDHNLAALLYLDVSVAA